MIKLKICPDKWKKALDSNERIERIVAEDGRAYWLKKSAPARGIFRYYALNFFSFILRLPLLKAVPQKGNQIALDNEIKRITELTAAGVMVPKIVAYENGWILLEDLGASIIDDLKENRKDQKRVRIIFSQSLNAIKNVHLQDQYLSQAFVRNLLMVNEETGQIGFIDFEDDPLSVMTLSQAQARDLLLFVNSTARFFVKDSEYFKQQIKVFLKGHKQEVIENIRISNNRMLWITKMPMQKALGHDFQKLKIGILALAEINS